MKPKFNEDTLSEQPAIEQLKRLQYEYIHGDNLDPELKDDGERSSRREVVLINRLKQKLADINPHLTEDSIDKAILLLTTGHRMRFTMVSLFRSLRPPDASSFSIRWFRA